LKKLKTVTADITVIGEEKMEFTTPKMKETIKKQTSKRVSEDAANSLGTILETFAGDVAEEAKAVAEEDGRKTVRREDIRQALE